uniref:Uncharacterized protein n=1 Tax=Rhodnius prolixus TaxID=13249 RepID=T1I3L9_RHOPR
MGIEKEGSEYLIPWGSGRSGDLLCVGLGPSGGDRDCEDASYGRATFYSVAHGAL